MSIKKFNLPTFEEWNKKDKKCLVQLGDYYCKIALLSWNPSSNEATYAFGVSTDDNPLNIYTECIFYESFRVKDTDSEFKALMLMELSEWYNGITAKFDRFWEEYITSKYIEQ